MTDKGLHDVQTVHWRQLLQWQEWASPHCRAGGKGFEQNFDPTIQDWQKAYKPVDKALNKMFETRITNDNARKVQFELAVVRSSFLTPAHTFSVHCTPSQSRQVCYSRNHVAAPRCALLCLNALSGERGAACVLATAYPGLHEVGMCFPWASQCLSDGSKSLKSMLMHARGM